MKRSKHGQLGAAFIETAIALPVMLGALYAVAYGIRVGTNAERSEEAVRYSGVLQQQSDPYIDYSLFTLYNNLGTKSNVATDACVAPPLLFFFGGNSVTDAPGTPADAPVYADFWRPRSAQPGCSNPARVTLNSATYTRNLLLITTTPSITLTLDDTSLLPGSQIGGATVSAAHAFYKSPDLSSLMHCIKGLSDSVSPSLQPSLDPNPVVESTPMSANPDYLPVTVTPDCSAGAGAPVPIPSQPPYMPTSAPTAPPPASPPPTTAPTPPPTTAPTPPPTPPPTTAPTPPPTTAPTPPPTIAPTPPPTTAPTTAPTNAPTPPPTTAPTQPPTTAPTTPPTIAPTMPPTIAPTMPPTIAPTMPPTIAPTMPPTIAPTPKPTATPTPQGPSGPIS